ncbi:FAD-binding and (Fe-S)-binding domain-containing protein [Thiofilum flexile]|uniref:FAD-binding and (Fe-S)-binding domain-containing protein n=1 Tax=Thiofilum flexile TaxID=125627 RepID=UPI00037AFAC8|nr:FAD-binding and (Fe-S)-binding domain-containing protein [Thiofilum flexile]
MVEILEYYLGQLRASGFAGDIETQYGARIVAATDNSIYQVLPLAILYPKAVDDLKLIVQALQDYTNTDLALVARGGNTGTNGQSLNTGIVVDFARYQTEILAFDPVAQTVKVQPAVVLDQLNAFLAPHGLFFPPQVSTASRATIGGMVATDASGKGSRVYGKTSDYIVELEVVLADGSTLTVKGNEPLNTHPLYQACHDLIAPHQAAIERIFPKMNRGLTGYNLKQALVPQSDSQTPQINLAYLLAGSEGTLALTQSITIKAIPLPKHEALIAVFYADFLSALEHIPTLLPADPVAIEVVDDKILTLVQQDSLWQDLQTVLGDTLKHSTQPILGANFIQVCGETAESITEQCAYLTTLIQQSSAAFQVVTHLVEVRPFAMNALWSLRTRAVGLLGGLEGARRGIPFVEDAAVPPEYLPDFIREFRALLDSYGLQYGMFGHADVGCLHVRPLLDMRQVTDQSLIRPISDGVAQLAKKYGGLLWGEHGKGFRGEYVPFFFEATLYPIVQELKALFDPHNCFNPHKLATPKSDPHTLRALDRIDTVPLRGQFDAELNTEYAAAYHDAVRCNGNGQCFSWSTQEAMCPSYRATKNRSYSPKGRAALLREWARLNSLDTSSTILEPLSEEVYQSLSACLSCQSCSYSCPVKVDIPKLKSQFLHTYHQNKRRPLRDYAFAHFESLAYWGRKAPRWTNRLLHNPLSKRLLRQLGLVHLPHFSTQTLHIPSIPQPKAQVVLLPDSFNANFDRSVLQSAIDLLSALQVQVIVAPVLNNGKALYVKGFSKQFEQVAKAQAQALAHYAAQGLPLVSVDVVTRLLYQQEYRAVSEMLPKVQALEAWLTQHIEYLEPLKSRVRSESGALLLPHCMEQTASKVSMQQWQTLFGYLGLKLSVRSSGCCGMAGLFGHEAVNEALSEQIFNTHWRETVEQATHSKQTLLASGFSCRHQLSEQSFQAQHPVQYLMQVLG